MIKRRLTVILMTFMLIAGSMLSINLAHATAVTIAVPKPAPKTQEATPAQVVSAPSAEAQAEKSATPLKDRQLVAHVVWVKGTFYATSPGGEEKRVLKASGNVYMNDTLVTEAGSEAEIVYTDNSLMTFREDTKLYINEYNYQPQAKKGGEGKTVGRYVVDLIEGGFRTITGYIAKDHPDNYQVNTPVATIGVRGTEFSVVYSKNGQLIVKRYKGIPCITKVTATKEKVNPLCLDEKNKYAVADSTTAQPRFVVQEPDVMTVDVEVIPVTFSNTPQGFCGMSGCGNTGGNVSGFCIQ